MRDQSPQNKTSKKKRWTTTIPEHVAEKWEKQRKELGMTSNAEFIRSMVEAGQKELSLVSPFDSGGTGSLQDRILATLDNEEYRRFEEIRDELIEELEDNLNEELKALEEAGRIEMSPRKGWRK